MRSDYTFVYPLRIVFITFRDNYLYFILIETATANVVPVL